MIEESKVAEFSVPPVIKNFVYDLYQSIRHSYYLVDIQRLYEIEFREITDKYFSTSEWPDPKSIASDCGHDDIFLYFYRELTLRHLFTKLKPLLKDFYESWNNYSKIFEFLLSSPNPSIALNTQWVYDLMVEFIYQFQGFCQYRCQLNNRNVDDIKSLAVNSTAWTYPAVAKILSGLIQMSGISDKKNRSPIKIDSPVRLQFGFFASIELGRLECLCGDHISSLKAISNIDIFEHVDMLDLLPICYVNLYYHMGISQLLLRRFTDAIDTFSHIVLHISRILKPGVSNLRIVVISTLNKMLDKILGLATISNALSPGRRMDDQVRDLIQLKYKDKAHKLVEGDMKTFLELFEVASPKFIVLGVPEYSIHINSNAENFNRQVQVFMKEVEQNTSILKLRSYLRLYAAIEVSKLARFNDVSETDFMSILISFKHKAVQLEFSAVTGSKCVYTSDVNYTIQDGNVVIDAIGSRLDKEKIFEKYFISGIRKNAEMIQGLQIVKRSSNL